MSLFNGGWRRSSPPESPPPSLAESLQRTAADMTKTVKLQMASEAIPVRQLKMISDKEMEDIRKLQADKLGGSFACGDHRGEGPDVGDFIICDNYSRENKATAARGPGWIVPVLLAVAGLVAGGGCGVLLYSLLSAASSRHDITTKEVTPQEFQVDIWMEGGKPRSKISPVPLSEK